MIRHETVHLKVNLIRITRKKVLVVVVRRVVYAELFLLNRARPVKRAQGKRARTALPTKLLDANGFRTVLRSKCRRRRARAARSDDNHIVVIGLRAICGTCGKASRGDSRQTQGRQGQELTTIHTRSENCLSLVLHDDDLLTSPAWTAGIHPTSTNHQAFGRRHDTLCST